MSVDVVVVAVDDVGVVFVVDVVGEVDVVGVIFVVVGMAVVVFRGGVVSIG